MRKVHALARRRDSRQQVIPLGVVSEADDEFVHHLVFADSPRDGRDFRILRDLVYEVLAIEASYSLTAETTRHDGYAVHVRFGDHRFHSGVDVAIGKLPLY